MGQKLKACTVGIEWVPENFPQCVPSPLSLLCCLPSSLLLNSPLPLPHPLLSSFLPSSLLFSSLLSSLSLPLSSTPLLFHVKLTLISIVQVQVEVNEEGQVYILPFCWEKTWTLYTIRNSMQNSCNTECTIDCCILHSKIYYCVFSRSFAIYLEIGLKINVWTLLILKLYKIYFIIPLTWTVLNNLKLPYAHERVSPSTIINLIGQI